MSKRISIIGDTGRLGSVIKQKIINADSESKFEFNLGFNSATKKSGLDLDTVFHSSDIIFDCSLANLLPEVLTAALQNPKPLILCSSGWNIENYKSDFLNPLSKTVPIVIAPNLSMGANLQQNLAAKLAKIFNNADLNNLNLEWNIDILDKHHKNKLDSPSGTAKALAQSVKNNFNQNIQINSIRAGNIFGEHEISFTSASEQITIKHTVFNRELFGEGALYLLNWLENNDFKSGLYNIADIYDSNH